VTAVDATHPDGQGPRCGLAAYERIRSAPAELNRSFGEAATAAERVSHTERARIVRWVRGARPIVDLAAQVSGNAPAGLADAASEAIGQAVTAWRAYSEDSPDPVAIGAWLRAVDRLAQCVAEHCEVVAAGVDWREAIHIRRVERECWREVLAFRRQLAAARSAVGRLLVADLCGSKCDGSAVRVRPPAEQHYPQRMRVAAAPCRPQGPPASLHRAFVWIDAGVTLAA
jgi:hypothetical protein